GSGGVLTRALTCHSRPGYRRLGDVEVGGLYMGARAAGRDHRIRVIWTAPAIAKRCARIAAALGVTLLVASPAAADQSAPPQGTPDPAPAATDPGVPIPQPDPAPSPDAAPSSSSSSSGSATHSTAPRTTTPRTTAPRTVAPPARTIAPATTPAPATTAAAP